MATELHVGDTVSYHGEWQAGSYREWGWRWGVVIGRHADTIGINPSGLEMATVRFSALPKRPGIGRPVDLPTVDVALPCFRLES